MSSALFGGLHWSPDSMKVVAVAMMGFWLAAAYHWTHRLMAPILVHILNNTVAAAVGCPPVP